MSDSEYGQKFKHHSLALSGECSSGKSTLCRILSRKLGWTHIEIGKEFRRIAECRNLVIERFGSIPDKLMHQIDNHIRARINSEIGRIWDGRLACYLSRNVTGVFKIFCSANLNVRCQRLAHRSNIPVVEARRRILERDLEEKKVYQRLYDISDLCSANTIDFCLNTAHNSPEELANIVIQALESRKTN